jgi:hypothetical protein
VICPHSLSLLSRKYGFAYRQPVKEYKYTDRGQGSGMKDKGWRVKELWGRVGTSRGTVEQYTIVCSKELLTLEIVCPGFEFVNSYPFLPI